MTATADMTSSPILAAVDGYRGEIVDLDTGQVVDAVALAAGRQALIRELRAAGLAPGDRVILAVGNGPLFIAAWSALLMADAAPLLVHFETPPAELQRIARWLSASYVVSDARTEAELAALAATTRTLDCDSWGRLTCARVQLGPTSGPPPLYLPGVPLHLTSGTTAQPRVALRPAGAAVAEAERYIESFGIDAQETILAVPPMSHAYAHGLCVVTPMLTSARVATMRRFQAKLVFQACQARQITILPAVAAMLDTLLFGAGNRLHDPHRQVITGGAPLSARTAANFARLSGTRVRPLYGTTETGAIAIGQATGPVAAAGCVGPPLQGVDVDIRPPAPGDDVGDGVGLVHVRSASMMAGYLHDERIDRSALADGWLNTGDLGWIDDQGQLCLRGRQAEVINVSGMKVLPNEVEEVIATMPEVREVRVYAGSNLSGAHHVRAAVVPNQRLDVAAIRKHCQQHLVYYKIPSRIIVMDALPRSGSGKILSDQLP